MNQDTFGSFLTMFRFNCRAVSLGLLSSLLLAGCGSDSTGRKDVWGTVTWKGQPVPAGIVIFEPDASQGNQGPTGFATIQEGKYDTRTSATFKGCMAGPNKVMVQSGDGKNKTALLPYGHAMFLPYSETIDIPEEGGEIDLVVPDSVAPLPENYNADSE